MANSIRKDVQMEEDVASNHHDNNLPMLDIKVWMEEYETAAEMKRQRMTTEFYEKGMVGKKMLMEKSALAKKVKITSLTQMVLRRWTNQVGRDSRELKTVYLSKFMF